MSRPLRIAVFLGTFPVVSETFILRQITGLLELGHEVHIYADCPAEAAALHQPEVASHQLLKRTTFMDIPLASAPWEMPVWPLAAQTWIPSAERPIRNFTRLFQALPVLFRSCLRAPRLAVQSLSRSHYGHQAASLSALYRLGKLSSQRAPYDVLHAHFGPVGNSYRFATNLWRAPLLVSFHGYDFSNVPRKSGQAVYEKLFPAMAAATVNSDYMRKSIVALGCPSEKVHKIPYGIDLDRFKASPHSRAPDQPFQVLTVGRLVEKKGIEYSIRAFAKARERHQDMTYDIVGDGPLRPALQKLICELSLDDAVTLHGAKNSSDIIGFLERAHAFVLASITAADGDQEGTPVSLLEAQASALPVLATRHSGIPEIVLDGKSGFLLVEKDVEGLADRLAFLVENRSACTQMGQQGREFIAVAFSQQETLRQLLELYSAVSQK